MQEPPIDYELEKSPPHAPDAERAVIGAVFLDPTKIAQAMEYLDDADFYIRANHKIFYTMINLFMLGEPITVISVAEELRRTNELEQCGGMSYLIKTYDGLPNINIEVYAKIIKGKKVRRDAIKACDAIKADAYAEEDGADKFLERANKSIFDLTTGNISQGFSRASTIVEATVERAYDVQAVVQEHGHAVTGLPSGFTDIDNLTLGWRRQNVIVLAARPGMGKTALALMFSMNAAFDFGSRIAVFSLEMSKESLGDRILCADARVDSGRLRQGFTTPEEWARIGISRQRFAQSNIFIDDTPALSATTMRAKAMRLAVEHGQLDLVVIDYIQLMGSSGTSKRYDGRQNEVSQISREIKTLAKELNVPVILLSQLNRAVEGRTNHKPMLSDLRESGAIEQDCDLAMFIYRQDKYPSAHQDAPPANENVAEILLLKNRFGPEGTAMLRFDGPTTRFDNLYQETH